MGIEKIAAFLADIVQNINSNFERSFPIFYSHTGKGLKGLFEFAVQEYFLKVD
jgi:hypothetical protein